MQRQTTLVCLAIAASFASSVASGQDPPPPKQGVVLVLGAGGNEEYGQMFREWARQWRAAAELAQADFTLIGDATHAKGDRDLLADALHEKQDADYDRLWLVLIGHGTYDDQAAKFNLLGRDVTAQELAAWLAPIHAPTVVVNCASSSGPFINHLSAEGRVTITATKSGSEMNFALFGKHLAVAINDPRADLDKDDQVSLLEAFLTACRRVEEFYAEDARLLSEHALLDDNGDGLGTPASFFRGLRAAKQAAGGAGLDGARARQIHLVVSDREARMPKELRLRRDALELELEALRQRKAEMSEQAYFTDLEALLLQIARIYQTVDESDHVSAKE